jgi:hypothetical protein
MGQRVLTDVEIRQLLNERKLLPANWHTRLKPKDKADARFKQREYTVNGDGGHEFRIVLRQSTLNILDFSIILIFQDTDGSEYRLTRFNGKHPSEHTNKVEVDMERAAKRGKKGRQQHSFRNVFHVHKASERYQIAGYDIDGFAEPTTEYSSFETALSLFVGSNGFTIEPDDPKQQRMFQP